MKEIKKIANEAKKALDQIQNGKSYPVSYVIDRLEKAAFRHSSDQVIGNFRDVIKKVASKNQFISQSQLTELYHKMSGLGSGRDSFRRELGDLIFEIQKPKIEKDASTSRISYENGMLPLYGESEASKEFSGIFSLEKKSFSSLSDNIIKKAEKFTKIQLASLGCNPVSVMAVHHNDHYILCKASVDTSDITQVDISIPVKIASGIPSIPDSFIQGDKLLRLDKENLYVYLKDKQNFKKKASKDIFKTQRDDANITPDRLVVPASLEKFANLEDSLVAAASSWSKDQISLASKVLEVELKGFGIVNPQIRVASSSDRSISFKADVPTGSGRVDILIPVEFSSGRPIIPTTFEVSGNIYKLNSDSLKALVKTAKKSGIENISRQYESMERLSYDQLMDSMASGISSGDFNTAENALKVIESKFGGNFYLRAFDKFSRLLKHSSDNDKRDLLIKEAMKKGDMVWLPTSVEPFCPKLGLPASKVDFDEKGRVIPKRRLKTEELSGILTTSSKVVLS
jgi:hypothetical protein